MSQINTNHLISPSVTQLITGKNTFLPVISCVTDGLIKVYILITVYFYLRNFEVKENSVAENVQTQLANKRCHLLKSKETASSQARRLMLWICAAYEINMKGHQVKSIQQNPARGTNTHPSGQKISNLL